jgi:hypothetical protein
LPFGAFYDNLAQGEYAEAGLSLVGDAAMFLTGPLAGAAKTARAAKTLRLVGAGIEGGLAATRATQGIFALREGDKGKAAGYLGEAFLRLLGMSANAIKGLKTIPKTFHIKGQFPKERWLPNPSGEKRTIEEAVQIAKQNGVPIPEDVHFWENGKLKGTLAGFQTEGETARVAGLTEDAKGFVYWKNLYNKNGKIPIGINPEVLTSDEAIVAVFTHELSEVEGLRGIFAGLMNGRMQGYDFAAHTAPNIPGNFHDKAWELADEAVRRMRAKKK